MPLGGITALLALVRTRPADFHAPILVVQHLAPDFPSILQQLLSNVSALPGKHPQNSEKVPPNVIYVALLDHLLVHGNNRLIVKRGPKGNSFRPIINELF